MEWKLIKWIEVNQMEVEKRTLYIQDCWQFSAN